MGYSHAKHVVDSGVTKGIEAACSDFARLCQIPVEVKRQTV